MAESEYNKKYHLENRDKILARKRELHKEKYKDSKFRTKHAERNSKYYYRNQEKVKARNLERLRKARVKVWEHYGDKCQCCGETERAFFALDHINNDGGKQRKGNGLTGYHFYAWVVKNNFPDDLQILCHNCNHAKHFQDICPHQKA